MFIEFIVIGDPVGYLRLTQGQLKLLRIPRTKLYPAMVPIVERIKKYEAYKALIGLSCPGQTPKTWESLIKANAEKIYMALDIFFRNGKHPDPDNIFKAFADALFKNDNRVAGSFDFFFDAENPRVEVKINV